MRYVSNKKFYKDLKAKLSEDIDVIISENKEIGITIFFQEQMCNITDFTRDFLPQLVEKPELSASEILTGLAREVDVNDKGLIRCISEPFIVKSLDWRYEEEVRCILSPNSEGAFTLEELSLYKMPTNISKIYIGCKVDKTSKEYKNLITLANNKNVMISELKTSDDLFGIIEE